MMADGARPVRRRRRGVALLALSAAASSTAPPEAAARSVPAFLPALGPVVPGRGPAAPGGPDRASPSPGVRSCPPPRGWVQDDSGEWEWEEDDPALIAASAAAAAADTSPADGVETLGRESTSTPTLPSRAFRPKQSLGQNFLRDGNTVAKIVRTFAEDAVESIVGGERLGLRAVELGPGAGALTDRLVDSLGTDALLCVEIDDRAVELLAEKHPNLRVRHEDVLQVDYSALSEEEGGPLSVVGNLPYYITSQILFALADASHTGAVRSATVTMQWEVAQRIVAPTRCKDYGILSVVFQLYADCRVHFKIPPTVFYPRPKVDSALVGLRFVGPDSLRRRLDGVRPADLRRVVTSAFRQRRKTVRNGLRKLALEACGGDGERARELLDSRPPPPPPVEDFAAGGGGGDDEFLRTRALPDDWSSKRPEELSPGQFVELTRLILGPGGGEGSDRRQGPLGRKVWRKLKHGSN